LKVVVMAETSSLGPDGLYDGPEPLPDFQAYEVARQTAEAVAAAKPAAAQDPKVRPFRPAPARFQPVVTDTDREPRKRHDYVAALTAAIDVLAARLLCLIAVIGAVAMFGWSCVDPTPWRTYTDIAFAVVVVWPLVYLHLKKG
jgi:hypothetical protein